MFLIWTRNQIMLHILSICLIICRAFALNGRFYLQHFGALQLEGKERIKMDYCKCFYRLLNFTNLVCLMSCHWKDLGKCPGMRSDLLEVFSTISVRLAATANFLISSEMFLIWNEAQLPEHRCLAPSEISQALSPSLNLQLQEGGSFQ